MESISQTAWFSPSVYGVLHAKVNKSAVSSFFLPDTVLIEHSVPTNQYFSSIYSAAVLKKNKDHIAPLDIVDSFTCNVHPLDCCALVVYIDLNKNSEIVFKVQYLTPPQLRALMNKLREVDLTCVLQRVLWKLPELRSPDTQQTTNSAAGSDALQKAAIEARYKLDTQEKKQRSAFVRPGPQVAPGEAKQYQLIRATWRQDGLSLEGRRCSIPQDQYNAEVNARCSTFFTDHTRSDQFALSQSNTELINKQFTQFAAHVRAVTGKQLTYMQAFIQLLECPIQRYKALNQQPTFLFSTAFQLDGEDNDAQWSKQLLFSIRQQFKQPSFLEYRICKQVVQAFSTRALLHSNDQVFKTVYLIAMRDNATYQLQRNNVYELFNNVQEDLQCDMAEKRRRGYEFLTNTILAISECKEYLLLRRELESNDRPKSKCSRCQQLNATFKVPLKFLLSEPVLYFRDKIPQIVRQFSRISLSECYAAISAVVFNDEQYLQFKDNMMMCLAQDVAVEESLAEDTYELCCKEDSALLKLLLNETLCNNLHATRQFFAQISKIRKEQQRNRLDMQNLLRFYDSAPGSSVALESVVPNKLLRNAGIVKVAMGTKCFMNRLMDRNWLRAEFMICNACYQEVIAALKLMWAESEQ